VEKSQKPEDRPYEAPKVTDYGTLQELTLGGHVMNRDSLTGANNTAFPNGPS